MPPRSRSRLPDRRHAVMYSVQVYQALQALQVMTLIGFYWYSHCKLNSIASMPPIHFYNNRSTFVALEYIKRAASMFEPSARSKKLFEHLFKNRTELIAKALTKKIVACNHFRGPL